MSQLSAGQWQPKQTLPQKLYWNTADSPLAFTFRGAQDNSFNLQLQAYMTQVEEAIEQAEVQAMIVAIEELALPGGDRADLGEDVPWFVFRLHRLPSCSTGPAGLRSSRSMPPRLLRVDHDSDPPHAGVAAVGY